MPLLETDRLMLRKLTVDDAPFILELLNQPSFLRHVGDKGVRGTAGARRYILSGPIESYERLGFGLWLVVLRHDAQPIGICGLLKRESLPDVDIGFAFVPRFWSKGYAFESASAVVSHARDTLGLNRLAAIVSPGNLASIRLLEKLGFSFERTARLSEAGPEIRLFARRLNPPAGQTPSA